MDIHSYFARVKKKSKSSTFFIAPKSKRCCCNFRRIQCVFPIPAVVVFGKFNNPTCAWINSHTYQCEIENWISTILIAKYELQHEILIRTNHPQNVIDDIIDKIYRKDIYTNPRIDTYTRREWREILTYTNLSNECRFR